MSVLSQIGEVVVLVGLLVIAVLLQQVDILFVRFGIALCVLQEVFKQSEGFWQILVETVEVYPHVFWLTESE